MSDRMSVEIGCAPFAARPDTHFNNMCATCGADPSWFTPGPRSFGDWEWHVKPEHEANYLAIKPAVEQYLTNLYNQGHIRYGSW